MSKTPSETYPFILFLVVLVAWTWSALDPLHTNNWMVESVMIVLLAPVLYLLFLRYIRLSNASLTLISIFILLHIIGARYSYGSVPLGATLGSLLDTGTNMYDKLVHFSFGLLVAYPLYETFVRVARSKGLWSYLMPFMGIITLGALYEIYEWITVMLEDPYTGYLFIGGNDPFDTTKDLLAACVGALLSLASIAVLKAREHGRFVAEVKTHLYRDDLA